MYIDCLLECFCAWKFPLYSRRTVFWGVFSCHNRSRRRCCRKQLNLQCIPSFYFIFFDEVFYNYVSLCVVIHSVEFSDCCYITSYTQMINKNVLFPVDTRRPMSCFQRILSLFIYLDTHAREQLWVISTSRCCHLVGNGITTLAKYFSLLKKKENVYFPFVSIYTSVRNWKKTTHFWTHETFNLHLM